MAGISQIAKAVASLKADIAAIETKAQQETAVLRLAIKKLEMQAPAARVRKSKPAETLAE